jgi:hypothetical protein
LDWLLAVGFVLAQQRLAPNDLPAYEIGSVFPREISPARYEQVPQRELQLLGDQGWELVSVTPYVSR